MTRLQRLKTEFSTYHVIERGNDRKNIFLSDDDKNRFLEILAKAREKYNFLVYAYCLMDNHVHLLINDNGNDISRLMKSINVSYVSFFNSRYKRNGHLFQDRFKSEIVKDDTYLVEVSRYIHNNPVKAGIVVDPGQYAWSSYGIYSNKKIDRLGLLDSSKVLACFSYDKKQAITDYIKYVNRGGDIELPFLDIEEDRVLWGNDNQVFINGVEQARKWLGEMLSGEGLTIEELLNIRVHRDDMIRKLRRNSALSLKELGELFGGLSESRVSRILRNETRQEAIDMSKSGK